MFGVFIVMGLLAPIESGNAYLDPGSGSLILQIILATLLGGFVIIRSFWTRIKDGISSLFNKNEKVVEDELDE